jgi:tripartite-type tricarboxylate transporter receptor subunit TctC
MSVVCWRVVVLLVCLSAPAAAQQFPWKPITLIGPYAAGGNVDVSTRVLQAGIGNSLGQPIIVENRPGGAGTIAGEHVARSTADGHTLFVGSNGPIMLGPMTMTKPPYQWEQAFAPISTLAFATNMLVVRPGLPVKTIADLVAYAKGNPGKLTLATSTIASINHFMGELLKLRTGMTWTEVHYRGNAPAIMDLIAGHVDVALIQLVDCIEHIKAGRLRAIAVLGPERAAALPDVPTSIEAGFADIQGVTFNGVFAPKATPPAVVEKLSATIRTALAKPDVVQKLDALGSRARGSTPEEFTAFLRSESAKWTDVMKRANIQVSP